MIVTQQSHFEGDPSRTPFTSIDALVRDLVEAKSPRLSAERAIRYVTEDPVLNQAVLFTVSMAWISGEPPTEITTHQEQLLSLEKEWLVDSSARGFFDTVLRHLTDDLQ